MPDRSESRPAGAEPVVWGGLGLVVTLAAIAVSGPAVYWLIAAALLLVIGVGGVRAWRGNGLQALRARPGLFVLAMALHGGIGTGLAAAWLDQTGGLGLAGAMVVTLCGAAGGAAGAVLQRRRLEGKLDRA